MPDLSHYRAISEYWEEVKDQYPNISAEQFRVICESPWMAIKEWMRSERLPVIFMKYMGTFKPSKGTIRKMLGRMGDCMGSEDCLKRKAYLEEYLGFLERDKDGINLEIIDDVE